MLRSELYDDYAPSQLCQILRRHFGSQSDGAVAFVEARAHYLTLEPGQTLLEEGDGGEDVYFVLSGRLLARSGGNQLGKIGRGEPVGELAMFTGEPRSASIVASRRTTVARISRRVVEGAIARRPELAATLTRHVIERFRRRDDIRPPAAVPVTEAVVPISAGVDALAFARQLRAQQPQELGRIAVVERTVGARTADQHGRVIDAAEQENAAAYLVADPTDTDGTRACLTHADEIVLLADATVSPSLSEIEHKLLISDFAVTAARQTLVLFHDAATRSPRGLPVGWRPVGTRGISTFVQKSTVMPPASPGSSPAAPSAWFLPGVARADLPISASIRR
jgi:NTE family protein